MPITPDDKDWTWVLERLCPECGFDASTFPASSVGAVVRENAVTWRALLAHHAVDERPSPDRWSALEYACHVRDVFLRYHQRLALMLTDDDPTFPNWDQDASATQDRYLDQDPSQVADELDRAAARLADAFDAVEGEQWRRTGSRSDGARFTVDSFARYFVHDPIHHVWDVEAGYAALDRET
ncbi:MAG TPA: DinB family protein [Acidimicrobiales bacterium]|nr:DinB family protein [Acidimicrobiales bacterium]